MRCVGVVIFVVIVHTKKKIDTITETNNVMEISNIIIVNVTNSHG
jgi:hypothetical protein